jgi:hypothetical protein
MADIISSGRSSVTGRELNLPDMALIFFAVVGGLLVWNPLHIGVHDAPKVVPYESNAVPMSYTDQCGDEPVCIWWWQYDDSGMPEKKHKHGVVTGGAGWQLHYGPQADVPADARPARSLPVLEVQP